MTTTFYRAKLVLEEVYETPDSNGYPRQTAQTVAAFEVTGGDPGSAMIQALDHVNVLEAWHRNQIPVTTAGGVNLGREKYPKCPSCRSLNRGMPHNNCTHMWHRGETDIVHQMPAHMTGGQL